TSNRNPPPPRRKRGLGFTPAPISCPSSKPARGASREQDTPQPAWACPGARRSRRSALGTFLRSSGQHGPVAHAQQRHVARETRMPNLSVHPALLGAALVCFLFRRNDEEEKLLARYHAEDTLP